MHNINTSNIINSVIGNYTIYYSGKKNIFSYILSRSDLFNIIYEPNQSFSLIMTDDPIAYSQSIDKISLLFHSNTIVLFQQPAPAALKKEDRFILDRKLGKSYRMFFDKNIKNSWSLNNPLLTTDIKYGVPEHKTCTKTKNICILNIENNDSVKRLYQHIKNHIDCDMITDINDDLLSILSSYKICISPSNIYDSLLCASLGSWVFSSYLLSDQNIKNISNIIDYSTINDSIRNILNRWDSKQDIIENSKKYILDNYTLSNYYDNISNSRLQISRRAFIYEA